ncbi:hypothetical protein PWYN_20695 [Paenibacillus wynnii]|uniref:DUF218 domain-containing protein n=1 Tax=Paenibacillus wynnii TaxID=268407 RepID=A0A098M4X0_9BACL|nr:hypothetical protein PWYN_20695 [Paenibacillus wynnii]
MTRELIQKILFEDIKDDLKTSDCIFVPGSTRTSNKYRTPASVELYKQGRSNKILFSGGDNGEYIEAISMKEFAVGKGVPEDAILTETFSTNTKENVIESIKVLDEHIGLKNIKRILICTAFYHIRRCHLTFQQYAPTWIEYSFSPVLDKTTRPDNWWNYENGTRRVYKEINGLIRYAKKGDIMDYLIQ